MENTNLFKLYYSISLAKLRTLNAIIQPTRIYIYRPNRKTILKHYVTEVWAQTYRRLCTCGTSQIFNKNYRKTEQNS